MEARNARVAPLATALLRPIDAYGIANSGMGGRAV